jgi:putative aminopeptidase FrvX
MLTLIRELSGVPGVSGFEDEAAALIRRHGDGLGEWISGFRLLCG